MDLIDLSKIQKEISHDCSLRLAPFINDPLAFLDENKVLDKKVQFLKKELARVAVERPELQAIITEALVKIDENREYISKAAARLDSVMVIMKQEFKGLEVNGHNSVYQPTEISMIQTLWVEAFKEKNGVEMVFEAHFDLDKTSQLATVRAVSKKEQKKIAEKLKKHNGDEWEYFGNKDPFGWVYYVKRRNQGEKIEDVIKSAKAIMAELP